MRRAGKLMQRGKKKPDIIAPLSNRIHHLHVTSKDLRKCLLLQMQKQQLKTTGNMRNQGNMS